MAWRHHCLSWHFKTLAEKVVKFAIAFLCINCNLATTAIKNRLEIRKSIMCSNLCMLLIFLSVFLTYGKTFRSAKDLKDHEILQHHSGELPDAVFGLMHIIIYLIWAEYQMVIWHTNHFINGKLQLRREVSGGCNIIFLLEVHQDNI